MPVVVVSNSTPLIGLAKGEIFEALQRLYGQILIPPEVYAEVAEEGEGRPGAAELAAARDRWILVKSAGLVIIKPGEPGLEQELATKLPEQEDRAVVRLAVKERAGLLLADDRKIRTFASSREIVCLTTVGIVVHAVRAGICTSAKPILDRMTEQAFGISDDVYRRALDQLGEQ